MSLSIVHVIARLNVGGAALHVLQLAHEQARRGHDVVVVAGTLAAGEESMEYVADELGVRLLRLPVLQRELSPRADPAAILALRRIIRQRRPDVLHTHTAKAGATGRLAAVSVGPRPAARDRPHLPRPRPQRLLQQALGARLPLDREGARAHVRDADRRQRRGARRPRRLRRRAGPPLRRRPVRLRPAAVERGGRRGAAHAPRRDRRRRGHVRRRLGRAPDRDQASARPDPDAARAPGRAGRRAARARRRRRGPRRRGGARGRARRRRPLPPRRLPEEHPPLVRVVRRARC